MIMLARMNGFFLILVGIGLIVLLGVLTAGVLGMGKGGVDGAKKSNKLMRARIVVQALIVVFLLLAWATG